MALSHPMTNDADLRWPIADRSDLVSTFVRPVARPDDRSIAAAAAPNFVELFQSVQSLRTGDRPFIIQFVAPHSGAGTSTIARNFARAMAGATNEPVLLINATLSDQDGSYARPSLLEPGPDTGAENTFELVDDLPNLWSARLSSRLAANVAISPGLVGKVFTRLRPAFPVIVVDSASLDQSTQSAMISRYCDGTALVVQAEVTTRSGVALAQRSIQVMGGQLLGAVFARVREHALPSWWGMARHPAELLARLTRRLRQAAMR